MINVALAQFRLFGLMLSLNDQIISITSPIKGRKEIKTVSTHSPNPITFGSSRTGS